MKAMFKSISNEFNQDVAFKSSFSDEINVYDDAFEGKSFEYYNPMNRVNTKGLYEKAVAKLNSTVEQLRKASIDTQTGGPGTAGTALIPVYPDSQVVDRTIRETPLRTMMPRRAVKGLTYDYIPKTSQTEASWEFEGASIADQVDIYDRVSVPIKYLYAKGRLTGPSIAAMRGFIDPAQLDLASKTKGIREAEEEAIINGNTSTNPEEPNGLITLITTNTTDKSSANVTLADLRAEYTTTFNANGQVSVAVTDAATHNYIKGLLLSFQRQVENPSERVMGFGIPDAFEFDGVMFIKDRFMPTSSGSRRILLLDMRYIFMAVLQDLTYEEKFSENDNYPYLLKEYVTLVMTFEASSAQIYGIA
jgi:HK97 family phage major capsid protein